MRFYFLAFIMTIGLATAKQITIIGPATTAINGGKICVSYQRGKETIQEYCMQVQAGKKYSFSLPECASHACVKRTYATNDCVAHSRFRICEGNNVLDLETIGCRLQPTKPSYNFDPQVPPLRTGIVYGWTWR